MLLRKARPRRRALDTAALDGKQHHETLYQAMARSAHHYKLIIVILGLMVVWDRIERWPLLSAKQYAPVVLKERPDGSITTVGQPDPSWRPHDGHVLDELTWALQTLRGRTKDAKFDQQLWQRLWERCTEQGHAHMARDFEAMEKAGKTTEAKGRITIAKVSVNKMSEQTFDMRWEETRENLAGQVVGQPSRWRGLFTVVIEVPTTLAGWQQNPKGVWLDGWSIAEDKL